MCADSDRRVAFGPENWLTEEPVDSGISRCRALRTLQIEQLPMEIPFPFLCMLNSILVKASSKRMLFVVTVWVRKECLIRRAISLRLGSSGCEVLRSRRRRWRSGRRHIMTGKLCLYLVCVIHPAGNEILDRRYFLLSGHFQIVSQSESCISLL